MVTATEWEIRGTYFESCNCEIACPCVFLSAPTTGDCKVLIAWHIDSGSFGQANLNGLSVALAAYSPGTMTDGNWKVALYIDEQANLTQQEALTQMFGGQSGGHFALLASFIGEILGINTVAIDYKVDGKSRSLEVEVMDSRIEPKVKLLELKVIKIEGDSSHYRLGYQDFDQAGDYKSCGTSK